MAIYRCISTGSPTDHQDDWRRDQRRSLPPTSGVGRYMNSEGDMQTWHIARSEAM
jgi:hypothetical protein